MINLRTSAAWRGVWTAIVTPLKSRSELNEPELQKLIDAQIAAGVKGLVIGGSTGEGSLLAAPLFEKLLEKAQAMNAGRVPLVAGLGIGGTESCLKNIELARRLNYGGVLASPPAYVKTPQRGLRDHYLKLAEGGLPVCIYEIPGRAGSSIELSTLQEIAESTKAVAKNIVALKDASGNLQRALDERRVLKERFALLSGDDGTFLPFLASGGHGVISVVTHLVPRTMVFIQSAFENGKFDAALGEMLRISPLIEALFWESNPVPVKSVLAAQGFFKEALFCDPLVPMRKDLLEKLLERVRATPDRG